MANGELIPLEQRMLTKEQAAPINEKCLVRFSRDSHLFTVAKFLRLNLSYDRYYPVNAIKLEYEKGKIETVLVTIAEYGEIPFHSNWFCDYRFK